MNEIMLTRNRDHISLPVNIHDLSEIGINLFTNLYVGDISELVIFVMILVPNRRDFESEKDVIDFDLVFCPFPFDPAGIAEVNEVLFQVGFEFFCVHVFSVFVKVLEGEKEGNGEETSFKFRGQWLNLGICPFEVGEEGFEPPEPKGKGFTVSPNSPSLAFTLVWNGGIRTHEAPGESVKP